MSEKSKQVHYYNSSTGKKIIITKTGFRFLVDSHMHIESNNCAPLMLQWNLLPLGKRKPVSRRDMNDKATTWVARIFIGRLGKIGRLSTDMIADLFFGQLKNENMKEEMLWLNRNKNQINEIALSSKKGTELVKAGDDLDLTEMSDDNVEDFNKEFVKECAYYYKNKKLLRISMAKQMDMSYAHYWGKTGLPLYLEEFDSMYFINNFINIKIIKSRKYCRRNDCDSKHCSIYINPKVKHPRDSGTSEKLVTYQHLSADFKFKDHFENPDIMHKSIIFMGDSNQIESMLNKKYIHIIQKAPGEDNKTFEDFKRQCLFTNISVANHPLKLLAFFHYDPRRYYTDDADLKKKIDVISDNHSFFTYTLTKGHFRDSCKKNGEDFRRDLLTLEPCSKFSDASYLKVFLKSKMTSNDTIYKTFLTNHPDAANTSLFWGIKMYPRLGYKPDNFIRYPNLKDLYKNCCGSTKIPITAHCSFGGMKFADTHNYQIFDNNIKKYKYKIDESEDFVTYNYASPDNWGRVLKEFSGLKLNLAHFGGCDTWIERKKIDKDYTGEDKYLNWPKEISILIEKYDNVYTDLSCFILKKRRHRRRIAKKLVVLLNKYKGLKDRLLVGSDWYMTESKYTGVGEYFYDMFDLLKRVSKEVGYDAWHQFSYINPLRFAGLLEDADSKEKKGAEGPFKIDVEKFRKLEENIKEYRKIDGYKVNSYRGLVKDAEKINQYIFELEKDNIIKDSNKILKNNELVILSK